MSNTDFVIENGTLKKFTGWGGDVVIPDGVEVIDDFAFSQMWKITSVTFPDSLKRIGVFAFDGCSGLTELVLPPHKIELGTMPFNGCTGLTRVTMTADSLDGMLFGANGKTIEMDILRPEREPLRCIAAFRREYYAQSWNYAEDYLLPLTLEDLPNYDKLVATGAFEGFKMNEDGRLQAALWRLGEVDRPVSQELRPLFGEFLASKVAKAIKLAEAQERPDYIRALIEVGAITDANKKRVKKALSASEIPAIRELADAVDNAAAEQSSEPEDSRVDKKYLDRLKKLKAGALLMKAGLNGMPEVALIDGSGHAPAAYLQLIFAEYIAQHKKGSYDLKLEPLAEEVAEKLDRKVLAEKVAEYYAQATTAAQVMLLPVVFRFGDVDAVKKAWKDFSGTKWEKNLHAALLFSDTREAMLLADKNKRLWEYAQLRDMDEDFLRYTALYEFGFDEDGKKIHDLGVTTLEVTLNDDLTLGLFDVKKGKIVKSVPKKDAPAELYAAVSADVSDMKKNLKKAAKSIGDRLFRMFLDEDEVEAKQWLAVYPVNPLMRKVASLLVWEQKGKTFTMLGKDPVDADGTVVSLSDDTIVLAHPMEMSAADVTAWQKYFNAKGLKQPFAQIWEPVFDLDSISADRYKGIGIPAYRFKGQEKHGIEFHYDFTDLNLYFEDCSLDFDGGTAVRRHELDIQGELILDTFRCQRKSRAANHIVGLLDKWTVYGRILKDDVTVAEQLDRFTLAQIMEFIKVAAENGCSNVTAILLEFKNKHFADFDPMEEFTLD